VNLESAHPALPTAARARLPRRALRLALGWQVACTLLITVAAGALAGLHGAVSAALGGAICTVAFVLAGWLATRRIADSATSMLTTALLAEMVKVGTIVLLLGLTLVLYREAVATALLASFIASVVILALAVFVRDTERDTGRDYDRSQPSDSGANHGNR
jgi:ATP synthase protein I